MIVRAREGDLDGAFEANREDVRALQARAKWHAAWAVRLGVIGLLLLLPLAVEMWAALAVAAAAITLVLASGDTLDGNHHRAHRRFGVVLVLGVLAHVAWIPRMVDEGNASPLLLISLVGFMIVAIGSMSTVWAEDEVALAQRTEAERERTRARMQAARAIGRTHEPPGPLTRAELEELAKESGGKATPRVATWRGTPAHVNIQDERHPDRR